MLTSRIFKHFRNTDKLDRREVWGLWLPRRLRVAYKTLAEEIRVPISILVGHILGQWLVKNFEGLMTDSEARKKYEDFLVNRYLKKKG